MHLAETEAARTKAAGTTVSRTTRQHVQSARSLLQSAAIVAIAAASFTSLIGCGASYRPVVSAINPVGPSAQPAKYAVAISSPSPGTPGLVTIVDFSGDTVLITANIGVDPKYLVLNAASTTSTTGVVTTANTGYTINGDGTLNVFDISTSLITSQILETTLLAGANPVSLFAQGANTYVTETGRNAIGEFLGSPLALRQELAVQNPIYVVGLSGGPRAYALSQGATATSTGSAIAIDTTTNTPTSTIPLGVAPVYGIITNDGRRAFILNQGSGTVSVINAQTNLLDTFSSGPVVPPATVAPSTSTIPVGTNPLWADFAPTRSEMVVANAGSGTNNGTLSIISIPLCNAAAPVTNVNCDPNNPVDAAGFGTVLASPQVGINPVMVSALQDGTRAYVANRGNPNLPCAVAGAGGAVTTTPTGNCTVSVVNLSTNIVSATIPIAGRPLYIAATTGAPTGKVYVVCGIDAMAKGTDTNSRNMIVIRTDIDAIDTTIPLQGTGVSVRVTAQ
ncbi:YncE family protein [Granulicella arctica]|uniref:YncE family protein n=1 Tax=Granulicella arctica TaxID=940613 RepID=UPI0021DF5B3E|nr:YncE family protein [Granulicella arctica]